MSTKQFWGLWWRTRMPGKSPATDPAVSSPVEPDSAPEPSERQPLLGTIFSVLWVAVVLFGILKGCSTTGDTANTLRIVAGSGFSSFEPILKRWGQ